MIINSESTDFVGRKVLIVEDEIISQLNASNFLKLKGFNVCDPVASAEDAVRVALEEKPDLILMDIKIQGSFDGITAAVRIRSKIKIPVIFMTAYADKEVINRAKEAEPYGYIIKPFSDNELLASVEMTINKSENERKNRMREALFSTVLKNIVDAVIVSDLDDKIIFANKVATLFTGFSAKELENQSISEVFPFLSKNNLDYSLLGNGIVGNTLWIRRDGEESDVEYNYSQIIDEYSVVSGSLVVFRDITERKKNEQRIQNTLNMLRKSIGGSVQAMALTVETRDPYTAGHQKRVTELARCIANEMRISEFAKDGLRMAGIIHDLGKISVPAEILSKPGRLSDIEFNLIKIHPQVGFDILKNIDFPWPVAEIVQQHHERFNGSGYPLGLKGDEILLEARILLVADVVEAMASHRPYRPAMPLQMAIDEIVRNKGIYYDSAVVEACLVILNDPKFSFDSKL